MYTAPIKDMEFVINEVADLQRVASLPGNEETTPELVSAVLEEANKIASEVLAPLNRKGDLEGAVLQDGKVKMPDGWKQAYEQFVAGGWNGLTFAPDLGGQGLPWLVATAIQEMWASSNMAFGLTPLLTQAAIEAVIAHGSAEQKAAYLPKMVSGEWTGAMNLTEPQAGSDLAAVKTKAVPNGDHYLISGQKIFITYGDHELTENIIHLVLARLPDAAEGVKGISLFIAPKYILNEDGAPGKRNDVRTVSLEHKLGIHASPTCVLAWGDNGGAVGYLVGEPGQGLKYMFTMMNLARHAVGLEGLAIAERSYQQALAFARERVQGKPMDPDAGERGTIIHHPDVRRMLMTMKSQIEAMRALCYEYAAQMDIALTHKHAHVRQQTMALVELMTPIVKGWCTEVGNDLTYLGVQIHGGMGFIEETGAAQHYRDARITTIYEGTTGIQAADLVGRKVLRDSGETAQRFISLMQETLAALAVASGGKFKTIEKALARGIDSVEQGTAWTLKSVADDPRLAAAGSGHFLDLWGVVIGGWLMARSALAANAKLASGDSDKDFYNAKISTAHFYAVQIMPQAQASADALMNGSEAVLDLAVGMY